MTNSWIFDFISAHPVAAFWLAIPVSLTLVTWAWIGSTLVTQMLNTIMSLYSMTVNGLVISIRGYAPQSIEAAELAKEEGETEGDDKEEP